MEDVVVVQGVCLMSFKGRELQNMGDQTENIFCFGCDDMVNI